MAKLRDAKANKAARAEAKAARKAAAKERRSQLWQAFNVQRQEDKRLLPYMIGAFVLIVGIAVAIGVWSGGFALISMPALGVVLGALVAFIIFGRRAQRSVYSKADGQTGAAAWALDNLRGKWRVTHGVAATGHFDAIHRVLGRPGVILVGEGSASRVKPYSPRRRSAPRDWSAMYRSTTLSSATVTVRFHWPSWSATSLSCRPTSPSSRWTRWSHG